MTRRHATDADDAGSMTRAPDSREPRAVLPGDRRSTRGSPGRGHPPVNDLRLLPLRRSLGSPVGVAPGGRVAISAPIPQLPAARTRLPGPREPPRRLGVPPRRLIGSPVLTRWVSRTDRGTECPLPKRPSRRSSLVGPGEPVPAVDERCRDASVERTVEHAFPLVKRYFSTHRVIHRISRSSTPKRRLFTIDTHGFPQVVHTLCSVAISVGVDGGDPNRLTKGR